MVKKKVKKLNKWVKKHRLFLALIILALILIFFVFGTKIFLFVNFILGSDTIVDLEVDKEYLELENNEIEEIKFKASITTNPFCKAICEYTFIDISYDNVIEKSNFELSPGNSFNKGYSIIAPEKGKGVKIYRFDMNCHSVASISCHTKEESSTRSIIVSVKYDQNSEEKEKSNELEGKFNLLVDKIEVLYQEKESYNSAYDDLNKTLIVNNIELGSRFVLVEQKIEVIQEVWGRLELGLLEQSLDELENELKEIEKILIQIKQNLIEYIEGYNEIVYSLNGYGDVLDNESFEDGLKLIKQRTSLSYKKEILANMTENIESQHNDYYDFLCKINRTCVETDTNCSRLSKLMIEINESMREEFLLQNYSENIAFWNNISLKIEDIKNGSLFDENLTPALMKILVNDFNCKIIDVDLEIIELNVTKRTELNISLKEQKLECCIFNECNECCVDCAENNYPIIFLHGHAIEKDLSAEYSLEGFNRIQEKLEEDGYINAGTITLFSGYDVPNGILGLLNVSFTIRASYYFDIFKNPENYVVVQTKSENIDTYAIRLNDLIDNVKYKTGKNKVNIVAFSMGGLVTRRYIQIFGEDDVNKVVLIGTPNKGIVGSIADYCPLTGERLECRDMSSDSLFINKLNSGDLPSIPIYNIIGTGCEMKEGLGDGAVLEEKAYLEGANNFIIDGKCRSSVAPLHLDLRNINMYPEVYNILVKVLEK